MHTRLEGAFGFPSVRWQGYHQQLGQSGYRYRHWALILDHCWSSLHYPGQLSLRTVILLADQIISQVATMHAASMTDNNITMDSVHFQEHSVYISDFEQATSCASGRQSRCQELNCSVCSTCRSLDFISQLTCRRVESPRGLDQRWKLATKSS